MIKLLRSIGTDTLAEPLAERTVNIYGGSRVAARIAASSTCLVKYFRGDVR
jgi:hypothetical protein